MSQVGAAMYLASMSDPTHAVAVIGGAVAGSEAASVLSRAGALAVVFEQKDRPYGKIEDGLPRWHERQRLKEFAVIDKKLTSKRVLFCPRTRLGEDVTLRDLFCDWGFHGVLLANGAWRDRPLPIEGIERFLGEGLVYQNPLLHWFNHKDEPGYDGPPLTIPDDTLVVGGGLASIDVIKIVQLELTLSALKERGIQASMIELEHHGIPAVLERHGLRWSDLGLRGGRLIYRRRAEDMPLAWASPAQGDEGLDRARAVRVKIMKKARAKYCFRFEPCRVPTGAIVEAGQLKGLVVARTEVPEGRRARPQIVPGSEEDARTSLVISSIGSTPEPIPGVPMHGEYYRYEDEDTGELKGYEGVYALGNVLTGQGNIRVSRRHATTITHHVIASYLGAFGSQTAQLPRAELDPLLAIATRRARARTNALLEHIDEQLPMSKEGLKDLVRRVRARQRAVGYKGYADWIART
ncbi:MAG: hypothetical protein ACYTFT_03340 [Planctomycetota bacterium]